jgi:Pyruvate/2-oxoacid:ferredoxin oxidoreductase delta subunit
MDRATKEVTMGLKEYFKIETNRHMAMAVGQVVTEKDLCVQCGICTFNCPLGIDIRQHVWEGKSIKDSHCLTCGECLRRCPRGVLRFERTNISRLNN